MSPYEPTIRGRVVVGWFCLDLMPHPKTWGMGKESQLL